MTIADGITVENSGAEFRNNSSRLMHIRRLDQRCRITTAGPNEWCLSECGKSPVRVGGTNNSAIFGQTVQIGVMTDVALDSVATAMKSSTYAKGQLTLEPNESLFINSEKSSGGVADADHQIGYHF